MFIFYKHLEKMLKLQKDANIAIIYYRHNMYIPCKIL